MDLSFTLRLSNGSELPSVNDTTIKTAPSGAIDQLGHLLSRIIHAFAKAADDDKIFMAKWDVKDGFWRMDCREGKEWNFAYVLPQPTGKPTVLVIPLSLQMGWVEVVTQYCETPVGLLPNHKFIKYVTGNATFCAFDDMEVDIISCPL
jgi:hypothetical protein